MNRVYMACASLTARLLIKLISKLDELPSQDANPFFASLVLQIVSKVPTYGIQALRYYMSIKESSFKQRLDDAPPLIQGFEDLYWLFSCNHANAGIISMAFDEAAYLFKVVRNLKSATCLEIGRFKGGSTFLLAAALDEASMLVSVDNHTKKTPFGSDGKELDKELLNALTRYGLEKKVRLVVTDSTSLVVQGQSYNLVFVDGDHSYRGVREDWLHVRYAVKFGGHVLFHDGGSARRFAMPREGVRRLVHEIEEREGRYFTKQGQIGTIVHFQRTVDPLTD